MNAPSPRNSSDPGPAQRRSIVARSVAMSLILALLLFVPAGSIAWTRGWLFLLVWVTVFGAAALSLWRINPEIFAARRRIIREGTKRWDRILLGFLFPVILAIVLVAALDDGRFHWSRMSWWGVGLGYGLLTTGVAITAWAQAVNPFFEPSVRIQTGRGHHIIDTGPYAIIRHPGYAAACLLFAGMALSLGSWWALIPVGVTALLLVMRTIWEDRTLRTELAGYAAYAQRVRFRWIPGVW
jgi:protein-S-isoprenylcysteine O-methyltransferase Ste14